GIYKQRVDRRQEFRWGFLTRQRIVVQGDGGSQRNRPSDAPRGGFANPDGDAAYESPARRIHGWVLLDGRSRDHRRHRDPSAREMHGPPIDRGAFLQRPVGESPEFHDPGGMIGAPQPKAEMMGR